MNRPAPFGWDDLPRYVEKPEPYYAGRVGGRYLHDFIREFTHEGVVYRMTIHPTRLTDKTGSELEFYPSQREFFTETRIRLLARQKRRKLCLSPSGNIVVPFQMTELELSLRHERATFSELNEGLRVLAGARMGLEAHDHSFTLLTGYLSSLISLSSLGLVEPDEVTMLAEFNPLLSAEYSPNGLPSLSDYLMSPDQTRFYALPQ